MQTYVISKEGSRFSIDHFPWVKDFPATPKTEAVLSWDEGGINVHFVSYETNLRAVETAHNTPVCEDSCMELFMQFAPETDVHYVNIEINPNGAALSSVNVRRGESERISPEEIDKLGIRTQIFDDRWEIDYRIPADWITRRVPTYRHGEGAVLRGNLYKCGDETDHPHFGCFHNIDWANPDFHRPEFFATFVLG